MFVLKLSGIQTQLPITFDSALIRSIKNSLDPVLAKPES